MSRLCIDRIAGLVYLVHLWLRVASELDMDESSDGGGWIPRIRVEGRTGLDWRGNGVNTGVGVWIWIRPGPWSWPARLVLFRLGLVFSFMMTLVWSALVGRLGHRCLACLYMLMFDVSTHVMSCHVCLFVSDEYQFILVLYFEVFNP